MVLALPRHRRLRTSDAIEVVNPEISRIAYLSFVLYLWPSKTMIRVATRPVLAQGIARSNADVPACIQRDRPAPV